MRPIEEPPEPFRAKGPDPILRRAAEDLAKQPIGQWFELWTDQPKTRARMRAIAIVEYWGRLRLGVHFETRIVRQSSNGLYALYARRVASQVHGVQTSPAPLTEAEVALANAEVRAHHRAFLRGETQDSPPDPVLSPAVLAKLREARARSGPAPAPDGPEPGGAR